MKKKIGILGADAVVEIVHLPAGKHDAALQASLRFRHTRAGCRIREKLSQRIVTGKLHSFRPNLDFIERNHREYPGGFRPAAGIEILR